MRRPGKLPPVLSSDDEQAADVDSRARVPPPPQADEAVRVKREQAAAAEEADAARWAEYGRREAAARADVKREVAGRREREAQDGVEVVAVSVNRRARLPRPAGS